MVHVGLRIVFRLILCCVSTFGTLPDEPVSPAQTKRMSQLRRPVPTDDFLELVKELRDPLQLEPRPLLRTSV
jgi:hypothetical protein